VTGRRAEGKESEGKKSEGSGRKVMGESDGRKVNEYRKSEREVC
jgi:hypothetical protein